MVIFNFTNFFQSRLRSPAVRSILISPLVGVLLLTGCSKSSSSSAGGGAAETLNLLPKGTVAFLHAKTDTEAFQALKKTSIGKKGTYGALETFEKMAAQSPAGNAELFSSIVDIAKKTKLVASAPDQPEPVTETLGFITLGNTPEEVGFGLYLKCRSGNDCSGTGQVLSVAAAEHGALTSPVKLLVSGSDVTGFAVKPDLEKNPEAANGPIKEVFFVSTTAGVSIASTKELAARGFQDAAAIPAGESGFEAIKASAGYQKALKDHGPELGGNLMLAFVDVAGGLEKAKSWNVPEEKKAEFAKILEFAPQSIAYSGRMDKALLVSFSAYFAPENIKKIAGQMTGSGTHPVTQKFPENTVFGVSLDGKVIQAAKQAALENASPDEKAQIAQFSRLFDSIDNLGLVVRGAAGASPFPELAFIVSASDAAGIGSTLKQLGGAMAQGSGLPVSGWQQKELSGVKMDFMMSPLGVGAFMASADKTLVIGSADGIVSNVLAGKNVDKEMRSVLDTPALNIDSARLAIFYVNFPRFATMLEGVQGSLAMFTGGQPPLNADQLNDWKTMGGFGGAVGFNDNAFHVRLVYG